MHTINPLSAPFSTSERTQQSPTIQVPRIRYSTSSGKQQSQSTAQFKPQFDQVICEEPLQITLAWVTNDQGKEQQEHSQVFTITMRTPGDDIALITGLLFTEGQIDDISQIDHISSETDSDYDEPQNNQFTAYFSQGNQPDLAGLQRQLITQSSCGICGKTSLKSLELKAPKPLNNQPAWLDPEQIKTLPQRLLEQQSLFAQTGGVHGAALFDQNYQLLSVKEDVGRHNAVDKVIGEQLLGQQLLSQQELSQQLLGQQELSQQLLSQQELAATRHILLLSGRVSFELVQKAIIAGYPVIIAVGAPSSLAILAAQRFDLTLIGFTKPDSFNIYHGHWRIKGA